MVSPLEKQVRDMDDRDELIKMFERLGEIGAEEALRLIRLIEHQERAQVREAGQPPHAYHQAISDQK